LEKAMKWGLLLCGLLIGAVSGAAGMLYWQQRNQTVEDTDIIFGIKVFYDNHDTSYPIVRMSGTLTGAGLAYPNNTYSVNCEQQKNMCVVASAEQIGPNQIGSMQPALEYPIVKWDTNEIVAADPPSDVLCTRATITIDRQRQSLLWLEEPINQSKPMCERAETRTVKFTIEDAPGWKMLGKK
jgi:hypothetical protein